MELAPRTLQCMPDCFRRLAITLLPVFISATSIPISGRIAA